jgi:hypothetical protein
MLITVDEETGPGKGGKRGKGECYLTLGGVKGGVQAEGNRIE